MAGSVNKVILIGNLGGDPDIKHTKDGRPVASFSVATSDTWRDKATGERKEKTEWHRIAVFSEGLCKIAEQYLKKGMKVYIEGVLRTVKWTDQGGVDRYTTQINLENFNGVLTMLQSAGGNRPPVEGEGEDTTRPGVASRGADQPRRHDGSISSGLGGARGGDMDDDIPF